ncbi:MAG: hypothetical protein AB9895_00110 [Negativicutes bacterium]
MRKGIFLAISFSLLFLSQCSAAQWSLVDSSRGMSKYVDISDVSIQGNIVTYWIKNDIEDTFKLSGAKTVYLKTQNDCINLTQQTTEMVAVLETGEKLNKSNMEKWQPMPDFNTISGALFKTALLTALNKLDWYQLGDEYYINITQATNPYMKFYFWTKSIDLQKNQTFYFYNYFDKNSRTISIIMYAYEDSNNLTYANAGSGVRGPIIPGSLTDKAIKTLADVFR